MAAVAEHAVQLLVLLLSVEYRRVHEAGSARGVGLELDATSVAVPSPLEGHGGLGRLGLRGGPPTVPLSICSLTTGSIETSRASDCGNSGQGLWGRRRNRRGAARALLPSLSYPHPDSSRTSLDARTLRYRGRERRAQGDICLTVAAPARGRGAAQTLRGQSQAAEPRTPHCDGSTALFARLKSLDPCFPRRGAPTRVFQVNPPATSCQAALLMKFGNRARTLRSSAQGAWAIDTPRAAAFP